MSSTYNPDLTFPEYLVLAFLVAFAAILFRQRPMAQKNLTARLELVENNPCPIAELMAVLYDEPQLQNRRHEK